MPSLNLQVASNNDDAFQLEGTTVSEVDEGGAPFNVGTGNTASSPDKYFAFRWTVPDIPSGATITSATFRLIKSGTQFSTVQFTLRFDDSDTAAVLTGGGDLSTRAVTTANTVVDDNINEVDGADRDVDATAQVQEVVNRGGWAAGNAMVALCIGDGAASFASKAYHSHSESPSDAARLLIDYVGGGPDDGTWLPQTVVAGGAVKGRIVQV